ncbi:hypothetical protein SNE40_013671 [Patella caerulea]|uniref:Transposable element P transposase-like RNase H domain-containing protein n=1 Tax=Patella caerulea TaxID=87958 RepID=A0AAN8JFI2_PATCE
MAVARNSNWKVTVAYFFKCGMTREERANSINQYISKLHDVAEKIASLTCDGPACHFGMMSEFGASLDPSNFKPIFPHQVDNSPSSVFLDVCHMIQLMRNL